MSTKVIHHGETGSFRSWELPLVEGTSASAGTPGLNGTQDRAETNRLPTAEAIDAIQKRAYAEGYEEGMRQAQADIKGRIQLLDDLSAKLTEPLAELDAAVERELVGLAVAVAERLARKELQVDTEGLVDLVHEAVAALPAGTRTVRIEMHPKDAEALVNALAQPGRERPWRIVEDQNMTRGGCRVTTETAEVDATVERRLKQLVEGMLGTET